MAKQTKICACGHTVPIDFDQEQIELTGKVSDLNMLDPISYKAEATELYKGIELYYYYEEDTLKFIDDGSAPKAKFKNLCESCLLETLQTDEPHYGDGVYLTQHKQLFDNATHEEVKKVTEFLIENTALHMFVLMKVYFEKYIKPEGLCVLASIQYKQ